VVQTRPTYTLRDATAEDIPAIAAFVMYWDEVVGGYSDFNEEDLRELWGRYPREGWLATDGDEIVGVALLWKKPDEVIEAFGAVHPEYLGRGIGSELLIRMEQRVAEEPPGVVFRIHVDGNDSAGRELVSKRGLELVRRNFTMRRALGEPVEVTSLSGLVIRTCAMRDSHLVHDLIEETFSEHWGWTGTPYETWERTFLARADVDPSLWYLVFEGAEPVGVLVGLHMGDTGWVEALGVRKAWRARGIGKALLETSFAEFTRRGAKEAVLQVDASNETGAVQLYERVGMSPIKVYETYEQRIDSPGEKVPGC